MPPEGNTTRMLSNQRPHCLGPVRRAIQRRAKAWHGQLPAGVRGGPRVVLAGGPSARSGLCAARREATAAWLLTLKPAGRSGRPGAPGRRRGHRHPWRSPCRRPTLAGPTRRSCARAPSSLWFVTRGVTADRRRSAVSRQSPKGSRPRETRARVVCCADVAVENTVPSGEIDVRHKFRRNHTSQTEGTGALGCTT